MRIRTAVLMTGLVLLVFYGCAYVNIRTPYDTDLNQTQLGSKTGTAEALFSFSFLRKGPELLTHKSSLAGAGFQVSGVKLKPETRLLASFGTLF